MPGLRNPSNSDGNQDLVERFFHGTGPTYDFMVHATTLGIDRMWKQRMVAIVRERVAQPRAILDLACGTGLSTFAYARAFPDVRIVGVELRDEYLQRAKAKLSRTRQAHVEFVLSRAEEFETTEQFDVVSASYLAKYADLSALIERALTWLKPNGLFIMHDFTLPMKPLLLKVWRAYFWTLQTIGSPLFPPWKAIYDGLPELIERTRWVSDLVDNYGLSQPCHS